MCYYEKGAYFIWWRSKVIWGHQKSKHAKYISRLKHFLYPKEEMMDTLHTGYLDYLCCGQGSYCFCAGQRSVEVTRGQSWKFGSTLIHRLSSKRLSVLLRHIRFKWTIDWLMDWLECTKFTNLLKELSASPCPTIALTTNTPLSECPSAQPNGIPQRELEPTVASARLVNLPGWEPIFLAFNPFKQLG